MIFGVGEVASLLIAIVWTLSAAGFVGIAGYLLVTGFRRGMVCVNDRPIDRSTQPLLFSAVMAVACLLLAFGLYLMWALISAFLR